MVAALPSVREDSVLTQQSTQLKTQVKYLSKYLPKILVVVNDDTYLLANCVLPIF